MIEIVIDSKLRFDSRLLNDETLNQLKKLCTYSNPDYYKRKAMGFSTTGLTSVIKTYKINKNHSIEFSRGELKNIRTVLRGNNIDFKLIDKTIKVPLEKEIFCNFVNKDGKEFELDELQLKSLKQVAFYKQGIIHAVTAAGKTAIILKLIEIVKQKALILVHTEKLFTQWVEEISKVYSIPKEEVGVVGYGKFKIKDITVSTVQTACKKYDKMNEYFGIVILDESHHCPAQTFFKTLNNFQATYRVGCTGTLKRKDGKEFLIYSAFGEVLSRITDEFLLKQNRIHQIQVQVIPTNFDCRKFNEDDEEIEFSYSEYINEVVSNKERNDLIVSYIIEEIKKKNYCIVSTDRLAHCETLKELITREGFRVKYLRGGKEFKAEGEAAINQIDKGILHCVIATSVGDEGVNIPKLNRSFIVLRSANNSSRLIQQAGRVKRAAEGKVDAIVYYFWDYKMFYGDLAKIRKVFGKNNVKVLEINGYKEKRKDK